MTTLYVQPDQESRTVLHLVKTAISREIASLEVAIQIARTRLMPFEQKYHVSSAHFLAEMATEDLEGGDDEYVQWAGEYRLLQSLESRLQQLQGITYSDSSIL
jgi:hypothetical protein